MASYSGTEYDFARGLDDTLTILQTCEVMHPDDSKHVEGCKQYGWKLTGSPDCQDYGNEFDPCRVGCTETRCVVALKRE